MRKLKLQVQVTIDGYMGGPKSEMNWMKFPWTDDLSDYIGGLGESVDTIVLGRTLAEGFIPTWKSGPEGETQESIDWMNNTPKVVFSNTLTDSPWENAVVAGGDLDENVNRLKAEDGGDLIVYGGSTLVRNLIAKELIDDLHLFVNPSAIGSGLPVFPDLEAPQRLRLVAAKPFECGIAVFHYQPERS